MNYVLAYLLLGALWGVFRTPHVTYQLSAYIESVEPNTASERRWIIVAAFVSHLLMSLLWPVSFTAWLAFRSPRR